MIGRITTVLALSLATAGTAAGQVATVSPHGALPSDLTCTSCHTNEAWSPARSDMEFDHATTGFTLLDRHEDVGCASCHEGLRFDDLTGRVPQEDCASCHLDVHLGTPTQSCASCHTTAAFSQIREGLVHPADFPLEGAHLQASCESCHTDDLGGAFSPPDRECSSCHMGDYFSSELVDHQALGFSTYCTDCHSTLDFRNVAFDHFTISSGFELRGQHAGIECTTCHSLPGGDLPVVPAGTQDCVSCHLLDYEGEHSGSGYPTDCLACHGESSWSGASFDHLGVTGFELLGHHEALDCMWCHVAGSGETIFSPSAPDDCVACHQSDYQSEHAGSGFPTTCIDCHTIDSWSGASFDHLSVAGFELIGNHAQLPCFACHVGSTSETLFSPTDPQDCVSCHQADYNDQHSGSGFSTSCLDCHTLDTWGGASFDHLAVSGFELIGNHDQVVCLGCHVNPSGGPTLFTPSDPQDCVSCHQAHYDAQHSGSGFSTNCLDCHTLDTWGGTSFDHLAVSGFELLPNHDQLICTACHLGASGGPTIFTPSGPQDCVSCHQADYNTQHSGSGFSTNCLDCHQSTTWTGASFDHLAVSGFDLIGDHDQLPCLACHVEPNGGATLFTPTSPQDCVSCHQAEYNAQHSGSGFSTGCLDCHQLTTWLGATFDHLAVAGFELIPNHDQLLCVACHVSPSGGATLFTPSGPQDCVACHQADYNTQHSASGFSTNCLECHQSTTWLGATFDHPFPITSGPHSGRQCTDCHTVPGDYSQFSCFQCHGRTDMDDRHRGRSGYSYDSNACLSCHQNGRA